MKTRSMVGSPYAGLNEKVCCKLACISNFSSKPAYGEPTMPVSYTHLDVYKRQVYASG